MHKGDKVRFIEPEEDEEGIVYEVLEDRDERMLVAAVEWFDDSAFRPTSSYFKDEMEVIPAEELEDALALNRAQLAEVKNRAKSGQAGM